MSYPALMPDTLLSPGRYTSWSSGEFASPTNEDHSAVDLIACGKSRAASSRTFGINSMKLKAPWKVRSRSLIQILIAIIACNLVAYAAPQQSRQSATNEPESAQVSPKPDDPAPPLQPAPAATPAAPATDPQPAPAPATASTPQHPSALPTSDNSDDPRSKQVKNGISNDRLFWTMPNFSSIPGADQLPPLTPGQKFGLVARSAFDPVELTFIGIVTLTNQAENTEPSYGQGMEGYGKRYATNLADSVIENFTVGAILPSVIHQDPRYYQLGKGSFLHRLGYAISRNFVTRTDSGRTIFNFSEVIGSGSAAAISTYGYHPERDQNLNNLGDVWATQVTIDTISNVLKEFWPDIRHKFQKHKPEQSQ